MKAIHPLDFGHNVAPWLRAAIERRRKARRFAAAVIVAAFVLLFATAVAAII